MTPNHLIRFTQALVLAALVAVLVSPAAALGGSNTGKRAPDWFERNDAAHPYSQGVPDSTKAPDWFERYAAAHPYGQGVLDTTQAPDWLERYAAAHPYGQGILDSTQALTVDGRSPDTLDATAVAQLQVADGRSPDTLDAGSVSQLQVADGRSPDTLDAAQATQPIEIVQPGGFAWGDAGIGAIGAALMIALIGGAMLVLARFHRRQRVQAT